MIETTPIPTTLEEAFKYARINGRIVPWAKYSQHIALYCVNHPELRWSTKNIGGIGSRNIFFSSTWDTPGATECKCPMSDLRVAVPDDWKDHLVPLTIIECYCCKEPLHEDDGHGGCFCHECFDAHCGYDWNDEGLPCKAGKGRK